MFDEFTMKIRNFILSVGFNQKGMSGNVYGLEYFTQEPRMRAPAVFIVDFVQKTVTASFPDYEYNAKNTTSPKTCVVTMNMLKNNNLKDPEVSIHNIKNFMELIIKKNLLKLN